LKGEETDHNKKKERRGREGSRGEEGGGARYVGGGKCGFLCKIWRVGG